MSARTTPPGQSPSDARQPAPASPAPRSPILDNEEPEQSFEEDIPKDDEGSEADDPHRPHRSD
jgi:hypothetical protein